ncbi:GDP-mannose 4,6-dehydratase [Alphaproteobacteria bacterium]|nr:GDP-mannose 4,6-dehydratase [Alphaproteobacteria bacterium]
MTSHLAVITGGAGFIGSHMVDLLVDLGWRVHVIDNFSGGSTQNLQHHADKADIRIFRDDIRSFESLELSSREIFGGARYVFHFAGIGDIIPSIQRPLDYMDVNIGGTTRILECARHAGVEKFIYAASSSCYGLASVPTDEDNPIECLYPYALSKFLGEAVVLHWHRVYGLPVNSLRIFNAYGPRVRTTGAYGAVFGVFLRQKIAGKPYTVVGDGTQIRDFVYVTDVVKAFLAAADKGQPGEIYNLGAGQPQTVNRLVEILGGEVTYIPERPGEPNCTWADITKIQRELGWAPEVSFEAGVAQMLENIAYWEDAPLWDSESISKATAAWFQYLK